MQRSGASLLFINQHYYPDVASTGQHLTDLAEHLAGQGHEVSVLCSRGKYLSGALDVPSHEVHNGVHIRRINTTSFGRGSHLGRLFDYAVFYAQALGRALVKRRYDYVITLTTPPLLCTIGALLKKALGQRYGIWSMDLHPDAEEALGMLRGDRLLTRVLHALNNAGYRNADFIVDLGPHMKNRLLEKGVPQDRLHTIPVWSRKEEIEPVPPSENALREELGLQDRFVVMYSGNAGLAHEFDPVLAAMRRLKEHPDIYFLFVGSGPRKEAIVSFAEKHRISNFQYLDYFPREKLKYSLSLGDVHLLTLRNDMAGIAVPGKLYGAMAAGRPIVMVGPEASEPGQTILKEEIGAVIDPARQNGAAGTQVAEALLALHAGAETRNQMGQRGRKVFLEKYEQQVACRRWARLINQVHPQ